MRPDDDLVVTVTIGDLRELVRGALREELEARDDEVDRAPPLISTTEAAELLNMPVRTVTHLCAKGELPAVRIGGVWRINRAKLPKASDAA